MPKASDPQCPLGFHPQFRRPNYCKRCFREYGDHKASKDASGSNSSLNSLSFDRKDDIFGSRDSLNSSKLREDGEGFSRSRSDLTSASLTRYNSEDESKGTYSRGRPMSWSAQDLRKAVDDAKLQVQSSRDDVQRAYGSVRSITQDLGSLDKMRDGPTQSAKEKEESKYSKEAETPPKSSFSSYLALRTKSPCRPPMTRTSSLPSSQSPPVIKEEKEVNQLLSPIKESTPDTLEPKWKRPVSNLKMDGLPPKAPSKIKSDLSKLPDLKETRSETSSENRSRKTIQILRNETSEETREVKSEDADASYVIQLRPKKKEPLPIKKVEIDLQPEVERLQKEMKELTQQIKELQSKNESLEGINTELMVKKPRFGDIKKQADLTKLQLKVDELSDEIKGKNKDVKDMKKELQKRPLPKDVDKTMEDLRSKLQAAEQLCEELMDENEDYKKEVRTLEDEIEEMQDNFREDQADEYRDLKRELEQRAKDCRVLQFKLKKAERRTDQLERDKTEVETKLNDIQVGDSDTDKTEHLSSLEKELNLAKEVSMKMHEEMKKMKDQLDVAEKDKKKLKEKVQDTPMRAGTKVSRSQMMGKQGSQDNTDQILRDLEDSMEREQDTKEQLKFAEEETKNLRKKLSRIEEENETLQLQLNKMSSKAKQSRQRSMERTGSFERSSSVERGSLSRQGSTEKPAPPVETVNGEELDPTELKIQLELNEQESVVLRRKIEDLETDNHRLQRELKDLFSSMSESKSSSIGKMDGARNSIYLHQKIRNLEQEISEMRRKISETDREKDRLKTDLESSKKRSRVTRTRSTDQEDKDAELLRSKIIEFETANEHLLDENKKLQLLCQKRLPLTVQEKMCIDNQVLEEKIKRVERKLKEANEKLKIKSEESSTKCDGDNQIKIEQLQAKIDELQGKYNKIVKDNEEKKSVAVLCDRTPKVPKDFTPKTTLVKWVKELEEECSQLHSALKGAKTRRDTAEGVDLRDKLQREAEKNEELTRQLKEERDKSNIVRHAQNGSDVKPYEEKISSLRKEVKDERRRIEAFESKLADGTLVSADKFSKLKTANQSFEKELVARQQSVTNLEKKLKDREETLKLSEKAEKNLRSLLEKADQRESQLKTEITKKEQAEDRGREERDEKRKLRIEKDNLKAEIELYKTTTKKSDCERSEIRQKYEKELIQIRKEKEDLLIRMTTLESELKAERKKRERLETESSVGLQGKASEIEGYRERVQKLEVEKTRLSIDLESTKKENDIRIKGLERSLKKEAKELQDLQKKHELLEEDYVVQKAQLTVGKENGYATLKKDYDTINQELKKLRETYIIHQDNWIKEKLDMQIEMKDLEQKCKNGGGILHSERQKLKSIIEDKTQQIDSLKMEAESLNNQLSYHRREAEDLKKKVDDLEKLQEFADKKQSSVSAGTRQYETTIKDLKSRMTVLEKAHKADTNKIKIRYDAKVKALSEEVSTLTHHMTKYRRERDTYKEMLNGAQKTIAELKGGAMYRSSRADTASEAKAHLNEVQDLQTSVTELEDKLADSRLENTKLKNDLVDQKTNLEIQLSDMQTKLHEYEEDRLLEGAGRRVPGLRTRLELNWQKEREEQQRLIQETAALAKDLRQTLYELEREKDMERIEAKRKIDHMKKAVSMEHQDTKGKVQELQRDLLELREAHAKLRQINEKLRREKDRTEVEREAMRDKFLGSSRESLNQQAKMERLLYELTKVKDLSPLVLGEGIDGNESFRAKLPADPKPKTIDEFTDALRRLTRTSDDLRVMMGLGDERDRIRRAHSFRKALSTESDDEGGAVRSRSSGGRGTHRPVPRSQNSQLYRKAQSLDHQMADERGKIWVSTDAGSTSSIESAKTDEPRRYKYDQDASFDRISTGSQTSDLDLANEQKSRGIMGMFTKFGKSRSIEDTTTAGLIAGAGLKAMVPGMTGSGSSLTSEPDKESTVTGKIKTLFKKNNNNSPKNQSNDKENVHVRRVASTFEGVSNDADSISSSGKLPDSQRLRSRVDAKRAAFGRSSSSQRDSFETDV